MKVNITNKGVGLQIVHDVNNRPTQIAVGQTRTVDMHNSIVERMQTAFSKKKTTLKVVKETEAKEEPPTEETKELSVAQQSALGLIKEYNSGNVEYSDLLQQAKAILPDDAFGTKARPSKLEIVEALNKLANTEQE